MGDSTRILIPQLARLYLAPVGTIAPDGPTVAPAPAWKDVGFFAADSLQFATDPSFEEVRSHQSNYPTRRWQTQDSATVQVNLQEWSATNLKAVYGGGTITEVTPEGGGTPYYRFTPPSIGARTSVSCIIEVIDGSKHYRRIIPRCEQSEGVELSYDKGGETSLPLRLTVLGSDVGDAWYEVSNDEGWAETP